MEHNSPSTHETKKKVTTSSTPRLTNVDQTEELGFACYGKHIPNFFVAVEVTGNVSDEMKDLSTHIANNFPDYKHHLIKQEKLHLTLLMLYIPSVEGLEKVNKLLQDFVADINKNTSQLNLNFKNLSTFPDRTKDLILWIGLEKNNSFLDFVDKLYQSFYSYQPLLVETDWNVNTYTPHVTIFKSYRFSKRQKNKGTPPFGHSHLSTYHSKVFGELALTDIKLFSLQSRNPSPSGYDCFTELLYDTSINKWRLNILKPASDSSLLSISQLQAKK